MPFVPLLLPHLLLFVPRLLPHLQPSLPQFLPHLLTFVHLLLSDMQPLVPHLRHFVPQFLIRFYRSCNVWLLMQGLALHSMARVNLNKVANFMTYSTTVNIKQIPDMQVQSLHQLKSLLSKSILLSKKYCTIPLRFICNNSLPIRIRL